MTEMDLREALRRADPIGAEAERWLHSPESERVLRSIASAPVDGPVRVRRRRPSRLVVVAAVLVVVGGGIAGASTFLFGQPAPESVKREIAGVDQGLPQDIRLNPDVENARAVAATGSSTLYFATLKDGGYCYEISTAAEGGRGAVCTTAAQAQERPIEVTVPFTDPIEDTSPVTVGGRVNADGAASLEIRYGDGGTDAIPFGDERFFVFDVPASHLTSVHHHAFELVALGSSGDVVGTAHVPAVAPEPPNADDRQPIYVETMSAGDLTKVLGVRGKVNVAGAVSLELRYPDGTTVKVSMEPDGSYRYDIPTARQDDFSDFPGSLVARDRDGDVVATATVAAVAWWEAQNRSSG